VNFLSAKKWYRACLPKWLRLLFGVLRIKDRWFIHQCQREIPTIVNSLKNKESINVAFLAMSVSFWKYDNLFQLMQAHSRFNPVVIIAPRPNLDPSIKARTVEAMKTFFAKKKYIVLESLKTFDPDILFYSQPYDTSVEDEFSIYNNPHKLYCYVPYAFWISNYRWGYDTMLHNVAWKLFFPTQIHLNNAKRLALNRGANVCVTGYPQADRFLEPSTEPTNCWKIKEPHCKRIIWAVHHSVLPNGRSDCSSFMEYATLFLELAKKYSDSIQIAFKPHPILKNNLYLHPKWGKARTDAYYKEWNEYSNTFLAEEDYIDLFKQSDALIHDCGSFMAEYLYTQKPCMYIGVPRNGILCPFGELALNAHYLVSDFDVEKFINSVVIKNNDPKQQDRKNIFSEYLLPPNHKLASQNIFDAILRDITKSC